MSISLFVTLHFETFLYNVVCCLIWVLNLVCHVREEHRLRVFEDAVLVKLFGPGVGNNRRLKVSANILGWSNQSG
jgi:hypothetical protein